MDKIRRRPMVQRGYLWRWRWRWASSHGRGRLGDSQRRADAVGSLNSVCIQTSLLVSCEVFRPRERFYHFSQSLPPPLPLTSDIPVSHVYFVPLPTMDVLGVSLLDPHSESSFIPGSSMDNRIPGTRFPPLRIPLNHLDILKRRLSLPSILSKDLLRGTQESRR